MTRKAYPIQEVNQILEINDTGVTLPVECRLESGELVLVKYWRNPFGVRVLLNEWAGSRIAERMGLTIPGFGLCNLSREVIENTNENEEIGIDNAGVGFFTKILSYSVPLTFGMLRTISNRQTERILLFDCIVNNKDRHAGNLLIDLSDTPRIVCIDNSHILLSPQKTALSDLSGRIGEAKQISASILGGNRELYDKLAIGCGFDEERLKEEAEQARLALSHPIFKDIFTQIPNLWRTNDIIEEIDAMENVLRYRVERLSEMVDIIISERSKR